MSLNGTPQVAMVLAAGLGKRMLPLTERMPKPLIQVAGKPLLDWGLDSLAAAGVRTAVVNTHYLPDQIIAYAGQRARPRIIISDERQRLLDSGGGIVRALPELGPGPFYVLNADTFWIDLNRSNLERLAETWDASRMDILIMLADALSATGHSGGSDFLMAPDGSLRRAAGATDGYIYAGAGIIHPRIFAGASTEPHSLNVYFDKAIAANRLFGMPMEGSWITVGTPDAIPLAEAAVASALAGR